MASNLLIPNVGPVRAVDSSTTKNLGEAAPQKGEFDKLLQSQFQDLEAQAPAAIQSKLKFSAHAMERLRDRGITMDAAATAKLEKAVDSAAAKGSREALVLTNDAAFIVSVANKTVITAVDRSAVNGNVFTNIDSTVII